MSGGNEIHFIEDINEETNEVRLELKPPDAVFFLDENVQWAVRAPSADMFSCFWR